MNTKKRIHTVKCCQPVYDKVKDEIKCYIMKAQRLNEKKREYLHMLTQCDDDQEMICELVKDCQDAINFNITKANELSESQGINFSDIASIVIDNASKCVRHILNKNIEEMNKTVEMAMTA